MPTEAHPAPVADPVVRITVEYDIPLLVRIGRNGRKEYRLCYNGVSSPTMATALECRLWAGAFGRDLIEGNASDAIYRIPVRRKSNLS